ncbi:unnamed protein product [Adineta steineri]|uniref:PKS/mFAS DH domain-containing protein n=1 Tax=Adineta steineri TaxID=433720 RepID=A0A813SDB9_9BILA|nr:unnamed protein product [Adineta steineri]CAF1463453.1 unnamed protein product [Adineta steineri]
MLFLLKKHYQISQSSRPTKSLAQKICFVFSGQGPPWWSMEMTKTNNGEWRLFEELIEKKNEQESRINDTNIAQPTIFAIQVALTALLVSWNIYPSSIISHSAGDQAAAFVVGRLTLEETVHMLALSMSEEEVENKLLKGIEHLACIAVVNSPRRVTINVDEKTIDEIQQVLSISYPNVFKACVRIENAFHSYPMNRFDIEKEMLSSLKDIRGLPIQDQKQNFIQLIVKYKTANVFLEISPHLVLGTSIRECYELTNQQQSSPPLILPTLKRKENEQITFLTKYFDNFSLYKFHLSPCWYESKDSSIQRLANRISTHPSLGIRQLNEQTSATWKSLININLQQDAFLRDHKIQDAILFPAVAYLELATAACHQLLSSKEDDQQQLTLIFEDVKFVKALILNKHVLVEVFIQIIMPMREWYIIFCNQNNLNKYSLNKFTLHAQGKIEIDYKQQKSLTILDRWTIQDIPSAYAHLST